MKVLADFVLDSDLCLQPDCASLVFQSPDRSYSLTLSNIKEPSSKDGILSAQLIFEADSLDGIRETARTQLAGALNFLVFATNQKFVELSLTKAIEWTPGVEVRQAVLFDTSREWDYALPMLDATMIDTAERLAARQNTDEQREAMRWYRRAIQTYGVEDQFTYFWFALEIASEALKGTDRVPSRCPVCRSELYCSACERVPVHRRFPIEAIQQTIERVHSEGAEEICSTLQKIRHTLMHGGRIASIKDELPCDEQQAVEKIARVTWSAISLMFAQPDPRPNDPITFGAPKNIVRRMVVAGARIKTRMEGDVTAPRIEDFPKIDFSLGWNEAKADVDAAPASKPKDDTART